MRHTGIVLFCAAQDTIRTKFNVLTKIFCPTPNDHVFQKVGTILYFIQDIINTNVLTKFHDDWTINVTYRVLTSFYYSHIKRNAMPSGGHVFQATETILEVVEDIIGTNLLTKFHDDRTINVASRVLKIGTNLLTNFHEDQTINVASKTSTRQMLMPRNASRMKCDKKTDHEKEIFYLALLTTE
ncbi:hypothetical protein DPMN_068805 [Dreissena polymorpha]|uniref:Uncharacterized protein n=1 Tax=Dreissena polymorpha TaxID=45954 RepID=A0A9D3YXV8_DREPO|nr:hypothetical protein DPMN_068805 [Dreissena polymorpha]